MRFADLTVRRSLTYFRMVRMTGKRCAACESLQVGNSQNYGAGKRGNWCFVSIGGSRNLYHFAGARLPFLCGPRTVTSFKYYLRTAIPRPQTLFPSRFSPPHKDLFPQIFFVRKYQLTHVLPYGKTWAGAGGTPLNLSNTILCRLLPPAKACVYTRIDNSTQM